MFSLRVSLILGRGAMHGLLKYLDVLYLESQNHSSIQPLAVKYVQ